MRVASWPQRTLSIKARFFVLVALALLAPSALLAAALQADESAVEISGEPGKTSELRTVRFTGEGAENVEFIKRDLIRSQPTRARIDRAQVTVTPRTKVAGVAAEYEISVTALPERYGRYEGELLAVVGSKEVAKIPLKLLVRLASTQSLNASPANVALPVRSGVLPGAAVLTNWPAAASAPVLVSGLPVGVGLGEVRYTPLMSSRGSGEFAGSYKVVKNAGGNGLLVEIDASRASPDKYTATAEIGIDGSDRRVAVPIEVLVRISPWCVLTLLLAGIAFGRAAKWMNDEGQKLLAAHDRVEALAVRASLIDNHYRSHLDPTLSHLRSLLAQRRLSEIEQALTVASARADLLERAASLRRLAVDKSDTAAQGELDQIAATAAPVAVSLAALAQRLDRVEAALTSQAGLDAAVRDIATAAERAKALEQQFERRIRRVKLLRLGLELMGAALLVFVGYELLYVNGSASFGANFSDLFGALLWGLGSDVAARTITSLGRVAPR